MTNKMKILIGLLVLGVILLVGGVCLLFKPVQRIVLSEIAVLPAQNSFLDDFNNIPSTILLKNVQVSISTADRQYYTIALDPSHPIEPGETILLVNVIVQNTHQEYKIIGISAMGYDASGEQVAWTLDDPLHAQFLSQLEYGETGEFNLHMNLSKNTKLVRIFGSNYKYLVP
jgi:hypothetical protein